MSWPAPVIAEVKERRGEIVLRLDQPINRSAFIALAPRIGRWVKNIQLGYDSVVIQLATKVTAQVFQTKGKILVKLSGRRGSSSTPTSGKRAARHRLAFLKAVLLWSMGEIWQAAHLLEEMGRKRPKNIEILSARSVVENRQGRWRKSSSLLRRANKAQGLPSRGMLPIRGSEHAPRAQLSWYRDDQEDGTAGNGMVVSGHGFVSPGLRLYLGYQYAEVNGQDGSPLAALLDDGGQSSHLLRFGGRQDLMDGSWISAGAIGTPQPSGAVVHGQLWDRWGATGLSLTFREPRWQLPVLVGLGAIRDAVSITRTLRSWRHLARPLRGQISARTSVQLERWRVSGANSALTNMTASGSLLYLSWRARPRLWAEYTIWHLQPLTADSGEAGHTVLVAAFARSHMHTLIMGAQYPLWQWLRAEAFLGYSVSYWNRNAAQFGGSLSWSPPDGLQAFARYQRVVRPSTYGTMTTKLTIHAGSTF